MPSTYITWFQAQQACALAGKHLCTNAQWQAAAAGTHDPGSHDGATGGKCHTSSSTLRRTGNAGAEPGGQSSCISRWGAEDMVGNLWEWVDHWGQAGVTWITDTGGTRSKPWPAGYGDAQDATGNINGKALDGAVWTNGMPAAMFLGGNWKDGESAGRFAISMSNGPTKQREDIGARCCRYR